LRQAFEVTITKKELAFEQTLNANTKVMHLNNELHQAQTQAQHDSLMIQALELTKSNFAGMKTQLDKFLVENKEYQF
jgi:predicted GTPase